MTRAVGRAACAHILYIDIPQSKNLEHLEEEKQGARCRDFHMQGRGHRNLKASPEERRSLSYLFYFISVCGV